MQFTCESCKTLLQIPDERVRGKRLLVRCKRCGASMQIADPALARAAASGAASRPAARQSPAPEPAASAPPPGDFGPGSDDEDTIAMDADLLERAVRASKDDRAAATFAVPARDEDSPGAPIWFAIVAGKQSGPLTGEDIALHVEDGAVGPRTYLWREGMDAWARAKDVPEVAPLFAPPPARTEPAAERPARAPAGGATAQVPAQQVRSPSAGDSEGAAQPEDAPLPDAGATGPEGFDDAVRDLARWASAELGKSEVGPAPAAPAPASRTQLFAPPRRTHTALWVAAAIAALIACGVVAAVLLSGATPPSAPQTVEPAEQLAGARSDPGQELAPSPAAALTPEALRKALDDNKRALQRCIDGAPGGDPGLAVRKLHIATTVAPSGAVLNARIDDRAVDQSALGDCLKRAAQKIAFPRFAGDPFDVDIPIVVTGAE